MKLDPKEFKRFKELSAKLKAKKISSKEEAELAELAAKKNEKGSNDLQWWNNYPELTKGAANVPFNYVAGTPLPASSRNVDSHFNIPGIAVVEYQDTIGLSTQSDHAFNAQMRQLWLDMHRKYRGMGGYQRSDLGMAILAIQGVFETLGKFERVYGIVNTYKIRNRNVPYTLYEAFSIAQDMSSVMADFRYGLNVRIAKLQQLCLPKGISAIEAALVNVTSIFKDSENARASLFAFDPSTFAVYDATTLSTGGSVKYQTYASEMQSTTPAGNPALSLQDMFRILDTQIAALLEDDDIAKMCSDLIAAYGPENVMTVTYVPEFYVVEPIHDYERLLQFHNLTIMGGVHSVYASNIVNATQAAAYEAAGVPVVIYQDNDVIQCRLAGVNDGGFGGYVAVGNDLQPYCTTFTVTGKASKTLLDTWVDNPSELEVMCGTRFTSVGSAPLQIGTGQFNWVLHSFGSYVVTNVKLWVRGSTGTFNSFSFAGSDVQFSAITQDWLSILQIDWHPIFYVRDNSTNLSAFGDLDNPAVITIEMLRAIHNTALYSAYKIPNVTYIN